MRTNHRCKGWWSAVSQTQAGFNDRIDNIPIGLWLASMKANQCFLVTHTLPALPETHVKGELPPLIVHPSLLQCNLHLLAAQQPVPRIIHPCAACQPARRTPHPVAATRRLLQLLPAPQPHQLLQLLDRRHAPGRARPPDSLPAWVPPVPRPTAVERQSQRRPEARLLIRWQLVAAQVQERLESNLMARPLVVHVTARDGDRLDGDGDDRGEAVIALLGVDGAALATDRDPGEHLGHGPGGVLDGGVFCDDDVVRLARTELAACCAAGGAPGDRAPAIRRRPGGARC